MGEQKYRNFEAARPRMQILKISLLSDAFY